MRDELKRKYDGLKQILADTGGLVVAYSGGVDSTLLLKAAVEALGDKVLAVTATSDIYPAEEIDDAGRLARELGVRQRVVEVDHLAKEEFTGNPPDRCYYCKAGLCRILLQIAREEGLAAVVDGSNVDDTGDYRPGLRAAEELGVRSPLREAGLGKAEIRELSRELGLDTWDKPSFACLASRFPYGDQITPESLRQVAAAERVLRGLGVRQVRVRHHQQTARIEVGLEAFETVMRPENRTRIVEELHKIGYLYVTLDLEGYRSGSMNVPLASQGMSGEDK